jgi:hypothetical protein
VVSLLALIEPFSKRILDEHGAEVAPYLEANGLPPAMIESLTAANWTPLEIKNLADDLIALNRANVAQLEADEVASLSSWSMMVTALEDLREGIRIRVETLGLPVRELTPQERASLDAAAADIEALLKRGIPAESLQGAISSLLSEARRLALETNNVDALWDDLVLAHASTIAYEHIDATPAGLRSYIDRLTTEARIDLATAASLQGPLMRAEQQLAIGKPELAEDGLSEFIAAARAGSGSSIPAEVVTDLLDYASFVGSRMIAPPQVGTISVNGGQVQRSNLEALSFTFDQDVNVPLLIADGSIADVVELHSVGQSNSKLPLKPNRYHWDSASRTLSIDLTIDGFGGSARTFLDDGIYQIRIRVARITNKFGSALADTDSENDGDLAFTFHRLFGDTDGDGDVDNTDAFVFKSAMNKHLGQAGYLSFLDIDGNGITDAFDFTEMKKRYGKKLKP